MILRKKDTERIGAEKKPTETGQKRSFSGDAQQHEQFQDANGGGGRSFPIWGYVRLPMKYHIWGDEHPFTLKCISEFGL